jgi:CRISPR/Cas system-associated exonuclease Cas4 (RecB family)
MKRGVVELNKSELAELEIKFPASKVAGTPLEMKLSSAYLILRSENSGEILTNGQITNPTIDEVVKIEISEDEIEIILDEIGIPDLGESENMKSLRMKFRNIILGMRNEL